MYEYFSRNIRSVAEYFQEKPICYSIEHVFQAVKCNALETTMWTIYYTICESIFIVIGVELWRIESNLPVSVLWDYSPDIQGRCVYFWWTYHDVVVGYTISLQIVG